MFTKTFVILFFIGLNSIQVARRYEELLLTGDVYAMNQFEKNYTIPGASSQVSLTESDLSSKTGGSLPGSASQKGGQLYKCVKKR